MSDQFKLHVKIGDAEFIAEGAEESVQRQYDAFMAALTTKTSQKFRDEPEPNPNASNGFAIPQPVSPDTLNRIYKVGDDKSVSLRILPTGENREADALLLILYGMQALVGMDSVLSGRLMKAASQSGLKLDRIDRVISIHQRLITEGGKRRGRNYGLNNQGVNRAIEIIREQNLG